MIKLTINLVNDNNFTRNIVIKEVLALLQLSESYYEVYKIHDNKIEIETDNLDKVLKTLCRSVFIKSVVVDNREIIYGRGFTVNRVPLQRVDTASAPLEPVVSRLLINLAQVQEGSRVLDPFCGSGGILSEARMCGAYVVCGDLVFRYVKNSLRNLDKFMSDFYVADSAQLCLRQCTFDVIVCDPPYSRLSVIDRDIDILYLEFLKESYRVLKDGGRLAISTICTLPIEDYANEVGFEVECVGYQYVNSSLTRKIVLLRKV